MAEQAERTTEFNQQRIDTNVLPVYIGPDLQDQDFLQGEAIIPIEVAVLFTGTNLVFALEGTWPADLVIDSATGQITGIVTDAFADYPNLGVRATNSKGFAVTALFAIRVISSVDVPVLLFPVPDQEWEVGRPISPLAMAQFFSGTNPKTYSVQSGALPVGVNLNVNGQISGNPDFEGTGSTVIRCDNTALGGNVADTNDWG